MEPTLGSTNAISLIISKPIIGMKISKVAGSSEINTSVENVF